MVLAGEIAGGGKGVTGSVTGRTAPSAESPIVAAGLHVIENMRLTTGLGDPETGEGFGAGADRLDAAGAILSDAFPAADWDGGASGTYADRNHGQLGRTRTIIAADRLVASVLARESGQIAATRRDLDDQADWLTDMGVVTTSLAGIPDGGSAKTAAEIAMVTKALGNSTDHLLTMQGNADANATELQTAVRQYLAVADEFGEPDEDPDDEVGAPRAGEPVAPPPAAGPPPGSGPRQGQGAPVPPSAMPSEAAPASPAGGGAEVAGMVSGLIGAILAPIGGILGGITQGAAQALQMATQAATQAVQGATESGGVTAGPALDADAEEKRERAARDEPQKAPDEDKPHGEETAPEDPEKPSGNGGDAGGANAPTDETARVPDDPAKTLPPDLSAGSIAGAGWSPGQMLEDFGTGSAARSRRG